MERKNFLSAAVVTPLAAFSTGTPERTPERDSVAITLIVGERAFQYAFYIDEYSENLMGMWRALCVAAESDYVSRVVLPRQGQHAS